MIGHIYVNPARHLLHKCINGSLGIGLKYGWAAVDMVVTLTMSTLRLKCHRHYSAKGNSW